jgi:hypothetical protein
MQHEMINKQKKQNIRTLEVLSRGRHNDTDQTRAKRIRFLALLKTRYGYDNEKAVGELERLLKQFYRINKSLGVHRSRLITEQLKDEYPEKG